MIDGVKLSPDREDLKQWEADIQGKYTFKSCCNIIDRVDFSGTFSFTFLIWKGIAPRKIELFLWLLLQDITCTRKFLVRRRLINLIKPKNVSLISVLIELRM
jgi:hypothetical protein